METTNKKTTKSPLLLQFLSENFYDVQKQRIAVGNQIDAFERNGLGTEANLLRDNIYKRLHDMEKRILMMIKDDLDNFSIWTEWLKNISGMGPTLAGGLLAMVDNPAKFDTISKLWSYSGYAVGYYKSKCKKGHKFISTNPHPKCPVFKDNKGNYCNENTEVIDRVYDKAARRERGYVLLQKGRLKSHIWKIGDSFVKSGKGYRDLYEQYRRFYDAKYPIIYVDKEGNEVTEEDADSLSKEEQKKLKIANKDTMCTKAHRYNMAKRKTVKIFLAHFWTKWRELEGLPTREPYVAKLGNHEIIPIIEK